MNRVTKKERERILGKALAMHDLGMTFDQVTQALIDQTGISAQRARAASAKAIRVKRYEQIRES